MSQRLARITQPVKRHPHTGIPLRPLGSRRDGSPIWPILGASEDDGNDDGDDHEDEDGQDDKSGSGKEEEDKSGTVSREEFESLKKRMQNADRRATEAEKRVKEYEDADLGEKDKALKKVAELEAEIANRDKEIADLRFANAFAMNKKYTWHDPELVLSTLRGRDDVSIDEDGKVQGLEKALDKIASEKQYLVKKDEGGDGAEGGPSGTGLGSGRKSGDKNKATDEELKRKYPALI